jgi:hypothetical protein
METAAKILVGVIAAPFVAALVALMVIWQGYVLAILWGWFMVPAFGLTPLSVPMAIGVSMVASSFTGKKRSYNEMTDPKKNWQNMVFPFLSPAFALGVGWVVKQYV